MHCSAFVDGVVYWQEIRDAVIQAPRAIDHLISKCLDNSTMHFLWSSAVVQFSTYIYMDQMINCSKCLDNSITHFLSIYNTVNKGAAMQDPACRLDLLVSYISYFESYTLIRLYSFFSELYFLFLLDFLFVRRLLSEFLSHRHTCSTVRTVRTYDMYVDVKEIWKKTSNNWSGSIHLYAHIHTASTLATGKTSFFDISFIKEHKKQYQ